MKIAVVYKSLTGNTKMIAEQVKDCLREEELVYFGEPEKGIEAELYFVGSWTDKGMCCREIADFLGGLKDTRIAYFGTAGFGGSKEYYDTIFGRVAEKIPASVKVEGKFFCQGKMPPAVRERYVSMMKAHPEDKNLEVSVRNFDEALSHPDENDMEHVRSFVEKVINS